MNAGLSGAAPATFAIAALAAAGVLFRPGRLPEYAFAAAGALVLVVARLLPVDVALAAVRKGTDVYLFLIGMMLLAEVARQEGLFDWTAVHAVRAARGSQSRLFFLVYSVGAIVTVFLSNDATAVVLTPAVYAAARAAKVEPLPYLFVCAFIANAASFVLPISNPANLVLFGEHMPHLGDWLRTFALPSAVAILATYFVLRVSQARALIAPIAFVPDESELSPAGRLVGFGILATAAILVLASSRGWDLGLPTLVCGLAVLSVAILSSGRNPIAILRHVSWGVLPLVAGLFVLVDGLGHVGAISILADLLRGFAETAPKQTAVLAGLAAAIASNLLNNLPVGLIAASTAQAASASREIVAALLIGVDLGPNLSITGSLATLLWLIAIRREGENVSALHFLKLGALVMPPALLLALVALVAF